MLAFRLMLALVPSAVADEAMVLVIARRFELDSFLVKVTCALVYSTDVESVIFRHLAFAKGNVLAKSCASDEVSKKVFCYR